ncbi:hypothetical protein PFISCL1PPCAC_24636, partial [Pristionchus fissidentatus]
ELQGAFIAGFEYEWNGKKRLADLVKEYYDYASRIDEAIGHIKEIEAHEVKLIGYDLADGMEGGEEGSHNEEEESGDGGVCLRVRLKVAGGVGEVRLRVAVEDPLAYPRAITMVERSELLRELKADSWQAGESLVANVVDLLSEIVARGEVAEAYEKSAIKGGEEEEDWDAQWCCFNYGFMETNNVMLQMSYASKAEVVIGKVATAAADAAAEVHSIPCKTNYTGPAPVEAYLLREKRDEDRERTALRGRRLEGVKMQLPEGFSCSLLQEKGAGRLDQVVSGASLVFWEHDRDPSERSTLHRALAHLHVAAALAAPAAE